MNSGPQEEPTFRDAEAPAPPQPAFQLCSDCGKPRRTDAAGCPWCAQAERWREHRAGAMALNGEDERTFTRLLWAFGLLLLTNVILTLSANAIDPDKSMSEAECRSYLTSLSIAEGVDTIIILITVMITSRYLRLPEEAGRQPKAAWALAMPLLAALLATNVAYHNFLLWLSGASPIPDRVADSGYYPLWQLVTNCVQPAVAEELFFRGVVFGWLSRAVGPGSAAFASASMFAAAHTGGLAAFPVLVLIGAGMAWMRWKSGSLLLPMLLHFLHNLIVTHL